ncbi:protein C3orf33 homolog isoform X2 [Tubulanus polymorphus]|uniref:protein C3orf33 homolog isoform X2 n=1 Tax=Tubulanus polymorphus TaxID=672921 RepID=UPI003DA43B46
MILIRVVHVLSWLVMRDIRPWRIAVKISGFLQIPTFINHMLQSLLLMTTEFTRWILHYTKLVKVALRRKAVWFCYGVGVVGVVVIVKNVYMFNQFAHATEIPARFIQRNVRLRGTVHSISADGILQVKHIPIATLKWLKYFKPAKTGLLPVKLAAVNLTESAYPWIHDTLTSKHIWFRLIHRPDSAETVHCIVTTDKSFWSAIKVNENLVRNGLANVHDVSEYPNENKLVLRFIDKLHKAESYAKRKGKGVWKRPSLKERVSERISDYKDDIRDWFHGKLQTIRSLFPWKSK